MYKPLRIIPAFVVVIGLATFAQIAFPRNAAAQTDLHEGRSWARVQALAPGAAIQVNGRSHSAHCKLKSVTDDTLTCVHGDESKIETFAKAEIRTVKISHRGRSALVGAAIGGGTGAVLGAASGSSNPQAIFAFSRGNLALIFGIPLAVLGAIVGALTDFTRSTIYKA